MERHTLAAEHIFYAANGRDILRGCALTAATGSVTGVLGRNGAGKSTLFQVIFGTKKPQDAIVRIDGRVVRRLYAMPFVANCLPQSSFMPGGLRVADAFRLYGVGTGAMLQHFPEIEAHLRQRFGELPPGTARLISVLLLLYQDTLFTILDEPFTHIMPLYVQRLSAAVAAAAQHKGIIVTDHLYQEVLSISDTLFLIREGSSIMVKDRSNLQLFGYLPQH